jgi:pimeloyl-ACP methyl ester carboxylesterase
VPVAVYRLKAAKQPAKAQMWMLNGGPGGAGFGLGPYGELVAQTFTQSIDVYLIDHRGTGESDFLDCPKAYRTSQTTGDFMKKCSQEIRDSRGAKLDGYSTTESAHDVRELIDRTAGKDQKVYVYGGSYGSYWAHRLLQIPNVRVDAVITDGNCISSTCTFDTPQVFRCRRDDGLRLRRVQRHPGVRREGGRRPEGVRDAARAEAQGRPLFGRAHLDRPLGRRRAHHRAMWASGVMPTLYRLDRCNEGDVRVLNTLEQKLQEVSQRGPVKVPVLGPTPRPSKATDSSTALQLHVIASEMISRPAPSPASLEAKARGLLFSPGPDAYDITYFDTWQTYPRDGFMDGWMSRDVPWLMMQGTFDFQTVVSLSKTALPKIADPSLQYVTVDGGWPRRRVRQRVQHRHHGGVPREPEGQGRHLVPRGGPQEVPRHRCTVHAVLHGRAKRLGVTRQKKSPSSGRVPREGRAEPGVSLGVATEIAGEAEPRGGSCTP